MKTDELLKDAANTGMTGGKTLTELFDWLQQSMALGREQKAIEEAQKQKEEEDARTLILDRVLEAIKQTCVACHGHIGKTLTPPKVRWSRNDLALSCPICGYIMLFDIENDVSPGGPPDAIRGY